jgi:hypothetical protein
MGKGSAKYVVVSFEDWSVKKNPLGMYSSGFGVPPRSMRRTEVPGSC